MSSRSTTLATCLLLALPAVGEERNAASETPWFQDVTAAAGVDRTHRTRAFKNPYAHIMEGYTALGASAAVADYDGDGFEDVFFTTSNEDGQNLLYRSNGADENGIPTFTEVAAEAGVAAGNDAANASANALWFDAEGDGDQDLLVVRFGQNLLYLNRGAGDGGEVRFDDVTLAAGLGPRYLNSIVAIAFDYDLDSDLDLFLGNYFAPVNLFDPATPRFFPESFETAANGGGMTVLRNDGLRAGVPRFTGVTEEIGIRLSGWTLDLGHADADHDGDDDLYVAADFGTDSFFRNNGDGTFTDVSKTAIGIDTKKGMNVDWGDFDRDGLYDVYVTNITDEYMKEGNFLWQNLGDLTFADVARETGTHATGWGWAGKFFDADNDGWLDLYVVNGWVSRSKDPQDNYVLDIFKVIVDPEIDLADARNWPPMGEKTLSGYQRNSLFHNRGGVFEDVARRHGVDSLEDGRGVAVADFDHDGRLDLFVTNSGKPPFLWRNVQPSGHHWLQLLLEGRDSNRDAVGARLWLHAGGVVQVGFVNGGNGFASQSSRRVHFGLGSAAKIDRLEVAWPSGRKQTFTDLEVDRIHRLVEGDAEPARSDRVAASGSRRSGTDEAATEAGAADLERLEKALAAEPDNLRAGADYRQAVIAAGAYDRCLAFFEQLVAEHPGAPNLLMNYGFAHVDKIPVEGAITQVILANTALTHFSAALELEETWLGRYTRGNSYLYWPAIFGRTQLGIDDLERAIEMAKGMASRPYHGRAWAALGDGYWRLEDPEKAREIYRQGLELYPANPELEERVALAGEELDAYLEALFETGNRVATHLREMWEKADD